MENIIGRQPEIRLFHEVLTSKEAELMAVYGRRRVGKTFLVRTVYEREILFEAIGLKGADLSTQLENFSHALAKAFKLPTEIATPKNWLHAFRVLVQLLESQLSGSKQVVFLDEFPWYDTPKSGFLAAFDHFWNSWASKQHGLVVVLCGSAASWMIQNVVKNRGGLHNRVTRRVRLLPFNLHETEQFLHGLGANLDRYQILQFYMATGGIPHYLKEIRRGESVPQAIDRLCFSEDGLLRDEFSSLYASLFDAADKHTALVRTLAAKPSGMTRNELMAAVKLTTGGTLTKLLGELLESGFISSHIPFDRLSKDAIFKLSDEYSLFYLRFIERTKSKGPGAWLSKSSGASWRSWSGLAFENICLKHVPQIKKALGISGVFTEESAWRFAPKDGTKGAQIDLLIDRKDHCINLVEIKFSTAEFVIDKKEKELLTQKRTIFSTATRTRKTIFVTMLTTFGVKINEHYLGIVQNQLTMERLFEPL